MIRKIISAAMAFVLLAAGACTASADNAAAPKVDLDLKTKQVKITGKVEANTDVTIAVLNPGASLAAVGADSSNIQNYYRLRTGDDGKFTYNFVLHTDGVNDAGSYLVKVKPENGDFLPDGDFFYPDDALNAQIIAAFIDAANEDSLKTALEKESYMRALGLYDWQLIKDVTLADYCKFIFNRIKTIKKQDDKIDTVSSIQKILKEGFVLHAYNTGLNKCVFDAENSFLYSEILGLDSLDKDNNVTLYKEYQESVSKDGKAKIQEGLLKQKLENKEEWQKLFMENVILYGLKSPELQGYAHVKRLLTAENAKAVGLKMEGEIDNEAAASIAKASGYSTIKELEKIVNDAIKKAAADKENDGTSKKNYGGGSGGGTGTWKEIGNAPVVKPDENNQNSTNFSDLSGYEWAQEAIAALKAKGIVNGMNDKEFAPGQNVSREQMAKIICLAAGAAAVEGESDFADVPSGAWYAPYVTGLCRAGFINGIDEMSFGTGRNVTRGDLCVMLCRALKGQLPQEGKGSAFADEEEFPAYASEAIMALANIGAVNGYSDGGFHAYAPCTRAEMAKIVYNACKAAGIF